MKLNLRNLTFGAVLLVTLLGMAWPVYAQTQSELVGQEIQKILTSSGQIGREPLRSLSFLKSFYEQREYHPAWQSSKQIQGMITAINDSTAEGLNPRLYHLKQIQKLKKQKGLKKNPDAQAKLDLLLTDSFFTLASHYSQGLINPYNRRIVWFKVQEDLELPTLLDRALKSNRISKTLASLVPKRQGYAMLKDTLALYRKKAKNEKWTKVAKGPKLEPGAQGKRVKQVKKRLHAQGFFKGATNDVFDEPLEEALKEFQAQHGLAIDGKVGPATVTALNVSPDKRVCQIQGNLDRLRAYDKKFGDRYLMVNIPDFHLSVIEKEKTVLDMPVIVGRRDRKSPILSKEMLYVVLSPFWHVPKSIAVKDKLPVIQKDPTYLTRHGMKLYEKTDSGLKVISPESVDWSAVNKENFNYRITQRPGAGNALGRVKFMFPNRHSVYIHDTPSKSLFKRSVRTFSSGCIRIEQPTDLAVYVLKDDAKWNRKKIIAGMKSGNKRDVTISQKLPVHIVYFTAWVDRQGAPHFRNDIYNYDTSFEKVLCQSNKSTKFSSLEN